MNKQISKVVIYYADGTYQEISNNWFAQGSFPKDPLVSESDIWKNPGEAGKWPFPPDGIGTRIVD
jgi:hypothetical protein